MPSQVTKAKRDVASNNLIQTDIRSMFYIASSLSQETGIEISKNCSILILKFLLRY